jgi:orotate phosphoribosyltransferase
MTLDHRELARKIKETAYIRGEFTLKSGRKSHYIIDKYAFETRPEVLRLVARHFAAALPPDTNRLAGVELGGVPLATAVSLETGLPFVIVKNTQKGYGTNRLIEGTLEAGDRVAMLEDVATTAATAVRSAQVLREAGAARVDVLVVVDREEGAAEAFAEAGLPYTALVTRTDLETL